MPAVTAKADSYLVAQDGSGDFTTIQAAIDAASDGDTIKIRPGTYEGALNLSGKGLTIRKSPLESTDSVTICSNDSAVVLLQANTGGISNSLITLRGLDLNGQERNMCIALNGFLVTIDRCTIRNGRDTVISGAGGIDLTETDEVNLVDSTIQACCGKDGAVFLGGAVPVAPEGELTVRRCTFEGNGTDGTSSAPTIISVSQFKDVSVSDSHFEDNGDIGATPWSAAITLQIYGSYYAGQSLSTNVSVVNCEFRNNSQALVLDEGRSANWVVDSCDFIKNSTGQGNFGAGMYVGNGSVQVACQLDVTNCLFKSNENTDDPVAGPGGALVIDGDKIGVSIADSDFKKNVASADGGAIYIHSSVSSGLDLSIDLDNCVFTKNSSGQIGGAIHGIGDVTVEDSEFTKNVSTDDGGAVYHDGGTQAGSLTIKNSKFDGNETVVSGPYGVTKGGALFAENDLVKIVGSTFTGNKANLGGAVTIALPSKFTISKSTFTNNEAYGGGGALFFSSPKGQIKKDTKIRDNSSDEGIGGVLTYDNPALYPWSIKDSTICSNDGGDVCKGTFDDKGGNDICDKVNCD
jgi:predicted outer membrane repeat protein